MTDLVQVSMELEAKFNDGGRISAAGREINSLKSRFEALGHTIDRTDAEFKRYSQDVDDTTKALRTNASTIVNLMRDYSRAGRILAEVDRGNLKISESAEKALRSIRGDALSLRRALDALRRSSDNIVGNAGISRIKRDLDLAPLARKTGLAVAELRTELFKLVEQGKRLPDIDRRKFFVEGLSRIQQDQLRLIRDNRRLAEESINSQKILTSQQFPGFSLGELKSQSSFFKIIEVDAAGAEIGIKNFADAAEGGFEGMRRAVSRLRPELARVFLDIETVNTQGVIGQIAAVKVIGDRVVGSFNKFFPLNEELLGDKKFLPGLLNPANAAVPLAQDRAGRAEAAKETLFRQNVVNPGENLTTQQSLAIMRKGLVDLQKFMGDSVIVAHQASFDIGKVNTALKQLGLPELVNTFEDTLAITRRLRDVGFVGESAKLGNVANFLGIEFDEGALHTADADARLLAQVYDRLVDLSAKALKIDPDHLRRTLSIGGNLQSLIFGGSALRGGVFSDEPRDRFLSLAERQQVDTSGILSGGALRNVRDRLHDAGGFVTSLRNITDEFSRMQGATGVTSKQLEGFKTSLNNAIGPSDNMTKTMDQLRGVVSDLDSDLNAIRKSGLDPESALFQGLEGNVTGLRDTALRQIRIFEGVISTIDKINTATAKSGETLKSWDSRLGEATISAKILGSAALELAKSVDRPFVAGRSNVFLPQGGGFTSASGLTQVTRDIKSIETELQDAVADVERSVKSGQTITEAQQNRVRDAALASQAAYASLTPIIAHNNSVLESGTKVSTRYAESNKAIQTSLASLVTATESVNNKFARLIKTTQTAGFRSSALLGGGDGFIGGGPPGGGRGGGGGGDPPHLRRLRELIEQNRFAMAELNKEFRSVDGRVAQSTMDAVTLSAAQLQEELNRAKTTFNDMRTGIVKGTDEFSNAYITGMRAMTTATNQLTRSQELQGRVLGKDTADRRGIFQAIQPISAGSFEIDPTSTLLGTVEATDRLTKSLNAVNIAASTGDLDGLSRTLGVLRSNIREAAGLAGHYRAELDLLNASTDEAGKRSERFLSEQRKLTSNIERLERSIISSANRYNDLADATRNNDTHARRFTTSLKTSTAAVAGLSNGLQGLTGAFAAIGLLTFASGLIRTAISMDKLEATLLASFGTMEKVGGELNFIRTVADNLGIAFTGLAQPYSRLQIAARAVGFSSEETRNLFESLTIASAALGQSLEETRGVVKAFEQILSKGNVQYEELKNQLGDRLPGAVATFAKAFAISNGEIIEGGRLTQKQMSDFAKSMERGQVVASRVIPVVARLMKNDLSAAAEFMATKVQAAINRVINQFVEFSREVFKGGLEDALLTLADVARGVLDQGSIRETVLAFASGFKGLSESIENNIELFSRLGLLLAAVFGSSIVAQGFLLLTRALSGPSLLIAGLVAVLLDIPSAAIDAEDSITELSDSFRFLSDNLSEITTIIGGALIIGGIINIIGHFLIMQSTIKGVTDAVFVLGTRFGFLSAAIKPALFLLAGIGLAFSTMGEHLTRGQRTVRDMREEVDELSSTLTDLSTNKFFSISSPEFGLEKLNKVIGQSERKLSDLRDSVDSIGADIASRLSSTVEGSDLEFAGSSLFGGLFPTALFKTGGEQEFGKALESFLKPAGSSIKEFIDILGKMEDANSSVRNEGVNAYNDLLNSIEKLGGSSREKFELLLFLNSEIVDSLREMALVLGSTESEINKLDISIGRSKGFQQLSSRIDDFRRTVLDALEFGLVEPDEAFSRLRELQDLANDRREPSRALIEWIADLAEAVANGREALQGGFSVEVAKVVEEVRKVNAPNLGQFQQDLEVLGLQGTIARKALEEANLGVQIQEKRVDDLRIALMDAAEGTLDLVEAENQLETASARQAEAQGALNLILVKRIQIMKEISKSLRESRTDQIREIETTERRISATLGGPLSQRFFGVSEARRSAFDESLRSQTDRIKSTIGLPDDPRQRTAAQREAVQAAIDLAIRAGDAAGRLQAAEHFRAFQDEIASIQKEGKLAGIRDPLEKFRIEIESSKDKTPAEIEALINAQEVNLAKQSLANFNQQLSEMGLEYDQITMSSSEAFRAELQFNQIVSGFTDDQIDLLVQKRRAIEELTDATSRASGLVDQFSDFSILRAKELKNLDLVRIGIIKDLAEIGITGAEAQAQAEIILGRHVRDVNREYSKREQLLRDLEKETDITSGVRRAALKLGKELEDIASAAERIFNDLFQGLEDVLVEFITTGTLNIMEFGNTIVEEITRAIVQAQIIKPLTDLFSGDEFAGILKELIGDITGGKEQQTIGGLIGSIFDISSDVSGKTTTIGGIAGPMKVPTDLTSMNDFEGVLSSALGTTQGMCCSDISDSVGSLQEVMTTTSDKEAGIFERGLGFLGKLLDGGLKFIASAIQGLGSLLGIGGSSGGGFGFIGDIFSSIFGGIFGGGGSVLNSAPLPLLLSGPFADGGVMTAHGIARLRRYQTGGVANSPQVALFGEGNRPEAFVPLPDGRRIPVKMESSQQPITVINKWNITTNDAQSFRKSLGQIEAEMGQRVNRSLARNRG